MAGRYYLGMEPAYHFCDILFRTEASISSMSRGAFLSLIQLVTDGHSDRLRFGNCSDMEQEASSPLFQNSYKI